MIKSRILSIIFDILSSLVPAYGAYLGGMNFVYSFILIFLFTQFVELIYYKGRTAGMVLFKIAPQNKNGDKSSLLKMIFYHFALTFILINVFNPYSNFVSSTFPLVLIVPFYDSKNYNSVVDMLFRIHWGKLIST